MVGEDRRPVGGAHAGDVGQILDGNRHAGKHATLGNGQARQTVGVRPRALEAQRGQRIDGAVDRRNATLERVEEVVRGDVLATQQIDDGAGVGAIEFASDGVPPLVASPNVSADARQGIGRQAGVKSEAAPDQVRRRFDRAKTFAKAYMPWPPEKATRGLTGESPSFGRRTTTGAPILARL